MVDLRKSGKVSSSLARIPDEKGEEKFSAMLGKSNNYTNFFLLLFPLKKPKLGRVEVSREDY